MLRTALLQATPASPGWVVGQAEGSEVSVPHTPAPSQCAVESIVDLFLEMLISATDFLPDVEGAGAGTYV